MKRLLLLCALVLLCVSRTSTIFEPPEEDLCYFWLYGKEPYAKGFQCHEWLDGTEVKICCGTCSPPCCCSSEGSLIDHHWCPAEGNPSVPGTTVEVFISPFTKIMEHWMIFLSVTCGITLAFAASLCLYFQFKRFLIRRRIRKLRQERRRQRALCRQLRVSDTPDTNDAVRDDAVREVVVQDATVGGDAVRGDAVQDVGASGDAVRKDAVCGDDFRDGVVRSKRALCRQRRVSDTPDTNDAVRDDAVREDAVQDDAVRRDDFRDGVVRRKRALCRQRRVSDTPDTNDAVREDAVQVDAVRRDDFRDGVVRRKRALCRQRRVSDTPDTNDAVRDDVGRGDTGRDDAVPERSALPSGMGVSQGIQPAPHLSGPAVRFCRGSVEDVVTILPSATEEAPPYKITVARRYSS